MYKRAHYEILRQRFDGEDKEKEIQVLNGRGFRFKGARWFLVWKVSVKSESLQQQRYRQEYRDGLQNRRLRLRMGVSIEFPAGSC